MTRAACACKGGARSAVRLSGRAGGGYGRESCHATALGAPEKALAAPPHERIIPVGAPVRVSGKGVSHGGAGG